MRLKFLRVSSRTVKGRYRRPVLSDRRVDLVPTVWALFCVNGVEISEGVASDAGS